MESENQQTPVPPRRGIGASLFLRPRQEASGAVFSAVIVAMLLVSLLFSVAVMTVTSVTGSSVDELAETDVYIYLSYLLYQIVYFGVAVWFLRVRCERPAAIGYRKARWEYFLLAAFLVFGLLFSLGWLNEWFVVLLEKLGYTASGGNIPTLTGGGIVGAMLVIAVLPAVLEETVFRGMILEGIKEFGTVAACLLGGLLFSVFHQSPSQTIYQFVCGAAFTLLALRADSLLPAIFGHFLNNAIILLDARFGWFSGVTGGAEIAIYVASAACLAGSLVYLIFIDRTTNRKNAANFFNFFMLALPGIAMCVLLWVVNLFS